MNEEPIAFIINPRSAGGRTGRRLDKLQASIRARFASAEVLLTRSMGDAENRAREAISGGAKVVVAVGGDGTASEVVNGLVDAPQGTVFAVLPAGTGCDLVKTLRMPRDLDASLDVVARERERPVDLLEVTSHVNGEPRARRCINVAGFGVNGDVVDRANRSSKRLGGKVTFLWSTLQSLAGWRAPIVRVEWLDDRDQSGEWEGPLWAAFMANGAYCGGGMWVGRDGRIDDGVAELTIIPERSLLRSALETPRLYDGRIGHLRGVVRAKVRSVRASVEDFTVRVDIDGEQPGVLPVSARVLPKAILVRSLSVTG